MELKIFVLTHKEIISSLFNPLYMVPIYNYNCHNRLDNFNDRYYYETYMIYDVYENLEKYIDNDTKYIGFCHYRRYFDANYKTLLSLLNDNKVILYTPENFDISVEQQYNESHDLSGNDLNLINYILEHNFHEYFETFNIIKKNTFLSTCNSFVVPINIFKEYCEFVFSVIDKFNEYHNFNNYKDVYKFIVENPNKFKLYNNEQIDEKYKTIEYKAKIGGFLIERLLNVYFLKNYKNNIQYINKIIDKNE